MKKLTFFFALVFVANAHSQIVEISSPNNYTNSLRGYIGEPIVVDSNLFLRYQDNNENFVLFKHGGTGLTTTTINNDLSQNFKLSTVPNQLNIHSSIESTIEVNIYNINGQYVYKNTHQSNLIEVNTSSFTNGTYILEILSDQQIVARNKVIITN